MKGRKPYGPRFTIKDKVFFLENKKAKPVDRSDRLYIDNWNLRIFWAVKALRDDFIQRAGKIRELLKIPELNPKTDKVWKLGSKQPPLFVPKRLYIGVNSQFLVDNPTIAQKLEKAVQNNFLIPYGWSFNYYPFVEHFILYKKSTIEPILPNPRQLQLILKHHKELGRNRYTKSDIAFLKQQALIEISENPKSKKYVDTITFLISSIKTLKNTDRRPKNPKLKLFAFFEFNDIQKQPEKNRRFLLERLYSIVDKDLSDKDEKRFHAKIRKLYSEYLKLIHSI